MRTVAIDGNNISEYQIEIKDAEKGMPVRILHLAGKKKLASLAWLA